MLELQVSWLGEEGYAKAKAFKMPVINGWKMDAWIAR